MGRKSLPDPSKKGRPYWGFVDMVTTNIDDVKTALQGGTKFPILTLHRLVFLYDKILILVFNANIVLVGFSVFDFV